jgi:hypothetical protein
METAPLRVAPALGEVRLTLGAVVSVGPKSWSSTVSEPTCESAIPNERAFEPTGTAGVVHVACV